MRDFLESVGLGIAVLLISVAVFATMVAFMYYQPVLAICTGVALVAWMVGKTLRETL